MSKKNRRIGMGMKPREAAVPTPEGQETPTLDSNLEGENAVLEGGALEAKITSIRNESGQNPIVATSAVSDPLEDALKASEVQFTHQPIPGRFDLGGPTEEELARSIYEDGKATEEVQNLDPETPHIERFFNDGVMARRAGIGINDHSPGWTQMERNSWKSGWADEDQSQAEIAKLAPRNAALSELEALAEKMLPEMMEGVVDVGQEFPVTSKDGNTTVYKVEAEPFQPTPPKAEDFVITKAGRKKLAEAELGLGLLETGEFRHTVRIAESYVEGAKQQAEADNMDLEGWLSLQLNTFLEQWWFAPGPKS